MEFDEKFLIEQIKFIVGEQVNEAEIINRLKQNIILSKEKPPKEHENFLEMLNYIIKHFDKLKPGLIKAEVLKKHTEIELLKIRTFKILNFSRFNKIYGDEKKAILIQQINQLENNPVNGFVDLYVKFQLFKILLDNLPNHVDKLSNDSLIENTYLYEDADYFLIELMFNPGMESNIQKNFVQILDDFVFFVEEDKDNTYRDWQDFSQDIMQFRAGIEKYILWYHEREQQLGTQVSKIAFRENLIISGDRNVLQGNVSEFILKNGQYCGTAGLFPCVCIIAIIKEDNFDKILLSHDPYDFQDRLDEIEKDYPNKEISYYFVGGLPTNLSEYIPLITENNITIKDIRLCSSVYAYLSCCINIKDNTTEVLYTSKIDSPEIYQLEKYVGNAEVTYKKRKLDVNEEKDTYFVTNQKPTFFSKRDHDLNHQDNNLDSNASYEN
ncbi:hypothetical protein [Legionella gresilensis]|uniref:hypothetical protein n=1 Tax=Legionella gresilensis TaxID=91823 RepID=UPI001041A9BD|nr:hypothetical protein [Legionella gresilensis]